MPDGCGLRASLDRVTVARFEPSTGVLTHGSPQTRFQPWPVGIAASDKRAPVESPESLRAYRRGGRALKREIKLAKS
jgi:hypothetical protein